MEFFNTHGISPKWYSAACFIVHFVDPGSKYRIKGYTLGMMSPAVLGSLMGRLAAHDCMELAQEIYNYILTTRQQARVAGKEVNALTCPPPNRILLTSVQL